jgi:hypothetical protein
MNELDVQRLARALAEATPQHPGAMAEAEAIAVAYARLAPPVDLLTAALEVVGPEPTPPGDLDESPYEAGVWDEWFRIHEGIAALVEAQR